MTWTLALDLVLALLMAGTIGFAAVLNRRLSEMRQHQHQLEILAETFRDATRRAEEGIATLKISFERLQEQLSKGEALADDLRFLIERGDSAADRLEAGVRSHAPARPSATMPVQPDAASRPASAATASARNAAAAMFAAAEASSGRPEAPRSASTARGPAKARSGKPAGNGSNAGRVRSEAEKNLLAALGMQGLGG